MIIAGVDGCKKGWVMVKYNKSNYTYGIYSSISELFSENQELERVLIDIPVGLASENFSRTVEIGLRKELKYRHSTVFNPPCREALYAGSDISARKKNLEIEGKSLSIQSLAIKNKIRETDEYLMSNEKLRALKALIF